MAATRYIIVIDRLADWRWSTEGLTVQTVDDYLAAAIPQKRRPARVINLCRRYKYMTAGYYCSLLAEARRESPIPTVADILDLSRKSLYAFAMPDLEVILRKILARLIDPPQADFDIHVFFGRSDDVRFRKLAVAAFDLFRYPLLRLRVVRKKNWHIKSIRPMGLHEVRAPLSPFFEEMLRRYSRAPSAAKRKDRKPALYDLAILFDPNEKMPPSNVGALERFVRVGRELRIDVEMVTAKDYHRIPEHDALFIRETTAMDNHTFRFARKAELEGIPVIDDPVSILRCTNKVYQSEALRAAGVPTPRTEGINRATFDEGKLAGLEETLHYPMVLKIPDGSFSRGVVKADNRAQLLEHAAKLFARSRIILAQEFMYTSFDWRIGVLRGKALYACQYLMSRKHWQVVNHKGDGTAAEGGFRTLPIEEAPADVVTTAVKAAAQIGNGLYGVDLKQNDRGVFVIEVNDNPNLDHGIEDKYLKGRLYELILEEFIRRIELSRIA
ncbi:MAG: RimK family protein [Magnetospirillum sp. WYHS-4]